MNMFNKGTLFKVLFNTALGIVLVVVWLKFVDLKQIVATIATVNIVLLIPAFLFMLLSPIIRALRLQVFLQPVKKLSVLDLTFLNMAAQMLNFFIPVRAGELAKGVYLNHHYDLKLGKSIAWIFLDRFVDFILVLVVTAILLGFVPNSLPSTFISTVGFIALVTLLVTYLMVFQASLAKKIANFLSRILIVKSIKIYIERIFTFFLDAFSILRRSPVELGKLVLLTILAYAADAAIWYFIFLALNAPQGLAKMYLSQLLSALLYLIPAAPGYVGSAEASGVLILSGIFRMDTNLASAMIVLFHITSAIFVIVFGLISIYSLKIDLKLIFRKILRKDK
ncbi:flippase-like domain-containing protein [Candidatus Daviesbacteria bacterium]|nr:flippase-like domain-containing protein [Candidatus Daviesbacteria bacterium]